MRLRLCAVTAAVLFASIGVAHAQYASVATNFLYRCAIWEGNVTGGQAAVEICLSVGPDAGGSLPGVPGADPETGYYGCLYLRKPTTVAPHSVCGEPKVPGVPAAVPHPAPFVMDPAMQTAVIEFELTGGCGKISTKLTLTGAGVPEPYHYAGASFYEFDGSVFGDAGASVGYARDATSSGTITSACRGTASLGGANAFMFHNVGAGLFAIHDSF